jgi:hypothetical protein
MEPEVPFPYSQDPATVAFRNVLAFYGEVTLLPNTQTGGPPLVSCPRLRIQHIRSYSPYLEAVSSIRYLRSPHAVVTRDPLNMVLIPIYSQQPSISGSFLLHPLPDDAPCPGLNMVLIPVYSWLTSISGGHLHHPQPEEEKHFG